MRLRSLVFVACVAVAGEARAQECPEGDWFCEPPESQPEPELEPGGAGPELEPGVAGPELPDDALGEEEPVTTPPVRRRPRRRWGFDLHALGALIAGGRAHPDAGMGGLGFGVRYRPIPSFAIDGSIELAFGTDYNGLDRSETAVLANALAFFNVRHPFQPYLLAGLGVSSAELSLGRLEDLPAYYSGDERYTYLGMQLGVGAELRLTRRAALRLDVLGFVRSRVDGDGRSPPEFIDPRTRRATNTSGGSFLRAGGVFYF